MNNPKDRRLLGKALLLLIIGAVLFACGLCLGAAATAVLTRPGLPSLSSGPAGSALDHPARPGTAVVAGDLEIRVMDSIRPADDIVAEGSTLNPRPGPGNEMILVTVSLTCRPEEETCAFVPALDFLLVSSMGVHRPKWLVVGLPNPLRGGEMQAGETVSGDIVFEVGKEETGLVLVYTESFGSNTVYLEVP
ncbi:MAG: DUF4352 domain-containing protein [Thermoflexales bacterium]|nr:DUF4352 domain-containing protein [Thermoflexales bacterium]